VKRALLWLALSASPAWAALTVNSVDVPTLIGRGQVVTGTVQVTRLSGSGNETVSVAVPALLEFASPLPAGCAVAGASGSPQTLTCSAVNPGAVGASGSFTFRARGLTLGGGSVSASSGASLPATDSFTVISGGDLTVGKTISPTGNIINGATVSFTLTPALGGDPLPAGAVITVTDQLPGGQGEFVLTAYSAPGYNCNSVAAAQVSRALVCTLTGPAASLGAITVQGRPTTGGAGNLTNGASVSDDATAYIDAVAGNNSASVVFDIIPGADPSPLGSFPANVGVDTAQTLSVSYVNGGPQTTVGGQVRLAVPAGFVLGTLPAGCVNSGPGTVNGVAGTVLTCTSGTVSSGAAQVFAIPVTAPSAPQSGNFGVEVVTGDAASLPGGLKDANLGNNQILVPFNVVGQYADLAITKNKTPGPIGAGSPMASTLVITNTGIAPAVYSAGTGATPLRVVDTMFNEEEFVSSGAGWTCTDQGADSAGAGSRRVVCVRDAAGTLAVGATLSLVVNTRAAATLPAPKNLINTACTGGTALAQLGLLAANGPQPPDGNENAGADCAARGATGTPVVLGQAQVSVVKESSRDGITWVDAVAAAPTVLSTDNRLFWRITVTTASTAANAAQATIPSLVISDTLPAILNVASPGAGIPGYQTPAAQVATTVLAGSASGSCPATVAAGSSTLSCNFTQIAPGTTLQAVVQVDRPFEAGNFTNTATLSSTNAVLSAMPGGQLQDAAALVVQGRVDPAVPSKTATPPNSGTSPRVGQEVSFTIVARNLGPNAIRGPMTVTDLVDPVYFVVLSATASGGPFAPDMACTVNTATGLVTCATPVGSTVRRYDFYTITIVTRVLKPTPLPAPVTTVTNTAQVALDPAQNCEALSSAAFGACNDAAAISNNSASALVDLRVPQVDMVAKKARVLPGTQTSFGFGDPLRYRFRAQNNGPSRAENIAIADRITAPAGYTVTLTGVVAVNAVAAESGFTRDNAKNIGSVSCTQAAPNADVACTLAAGAANFLAPNTEVNFELTFALAGPPAVVQLGNTALVCSDETLSGHESSGSCVFAPTVAAGNNIASVNELVFPKSDLAITKTRITAAPVNVNQPVEYAVTVRNNGGNATTQIRFTDVLPPGFEWVTGGAFTPTATPGAFAGLSVSNLACTASPATVTTAAQRQTLSCVLDGAFPGNTAVANAVAVRLYARPKQGVFAGPYLVDQRNDVAVSPGLDGSGQALSIDGDDSNNTASALVPVQNTQLSGTVFEDRDRVAGNAGTPQGAAQEPRIAGGTVVLTGTDLYGNAVNLSTTADASGHYSFTGLAPSDAATGYTVAQAAQPPGYVNSPATPPAAGAAAPSAGGTYASGGAAGASSYGAVVLAGGADATRYNFPEVRRPSLSGFVYRDDNANGTRDAATDPAIAGATVQLLDAAGTLLLTTQTDATGAYSFTGLDPLLSYTLQEPLPATPAGLRNGPVNPGLVGGAACASGCTAQADTPAAGTDRIAAIDLSAGVDGTAFNFGEIQTTGISGLVWVDNNRDTVLDAAETTRLPNVQIRLVQGADCASGTVLQTTQTLADGSYLFSNVRAFQNYLLCQTQPTGYGTGSANGSAGSNVATVSNLALGGSANNNFGETLASLAGSVYADTGAGVPAQFDNGMRDAAEVGIANVPVTLTGTNVLNQPVNITVHTDASGNYLFSDLIAANAQGYTVTEGALPPAAGAYLDGRDTAGTAAGTVGADTVSAINLAAGQAAAGYLFGELPNASISGTVYVDRNRNDTLDSTPTDARLRDVLLRLVRGADCSTGTELQRTTTDASGNYSFANVAAGGAYLVCESQPSGYGQGVETPGNAATAGATNSIAISNLPATGSAGNHFGERVSALAGSVYADHSPATPANTHNGVRDAGETGIAGVPVTLTGFDINNQAVSLSTTTDASGNYRFDDLLQAGAGGYSVTEGAIPASSGVYNDGLDRVGSAGGTAANDSTTAVPLGAGVLATNYDFGELPIAPITGTVFLDRDRDGQIDGTPTDGRIGGVVINLVLGANCSGAVVATTSTDASGNYAFSGISAGLTYTLCQVQPAGYADGGVIAGGSGSSAAANAITLSNLPIAGSAGNHFGEFAGSIAGSVYLDTNNDGTPQGGEPGIAGVTVTLTGTDANGPVTRSTVTDASGNYSFSDLLAAVGAGYTVTEQAAQPAVNGIATLNGRSSAGSIAGTPTGSATPVATTPSAVGGITLAAGADSINNRFGELLPVAISGTVFIDVNDNGLQNLPADSGLAGVQVVITGTDDTGANVTRTVNTAADGSYAVSGLRPGTYTVTQPTQPTGTSNGKTLPGSAGGSATLPTVAPSAITGIVLATSGATSTANNFAEIPNSSGLQGRVWLDSNSNGLIDGAETGIAGVTVELSGTDTAGRPVARSVTTDATGAYSFAELSPGNYTLREPTQPADTVNGVTVPGTRGGTATPVASTPSTLSAITLGVGDVSSANNFGEVHGAQVAGRVYGDHNNNGVPDGIETGLGGVTLVLTGTDDLGQPVNITVVTGADGSYSFNNLRPGNYVITQPTQPPGTVGGITTPGSAGGTATAPAVPASVISAVVLTPGVRSTGNNFGELTHSPDLLVSKSLVEPRFTVGFAGSYRISVRNAGEIASSGAYTVSDRLPTGLTLAATPAGTGWACTGTAGAGSFTCTSSTVLAAGATSADAITATVNVAAAAGANSPVNNVVMVDGGGEIDARRPSAAERDAFANNPASLPECGAVAQHNVCRTPTPVQLAASISGTAWVDNGSSPRVLDSGDRRLPGWLVEIIDTATGAIVGRATTAADGSYRVADLMPGVPLAVRFRDPASGIVFGYPVNGDTAPGSSGATCKADAAATGTASSCGGTGNSPQLSVVLAPGQDLPQQSLPVDPSGVVYDSGLRTPVPGAVVTLQPVGACTAWDPATGLVGATLGGYTINGGRVSMTVGADGFYQFLFGPTAPASCTFGLTVTPPPGSGYSFQSTAIPPSTGPLVPVGGAGSVFAVQPQAAAPTGDVGPATSYFLTLTSGSAGANVIHNHIPLDPALPTGIALSKTGDRSTAEIGDSVRYSITVRVTAGAVPRHTTVVDRLPAGFTYIRGTAMVGDTPIADPTSTSPGGVGPTLAFNLGPLTGGQAVLRYRVRVDVGALQGDGVNRAQAHACGVPAGCVDASFKPRAGSVATNEGSYRVKVSGGVFTTDACLAGKVFVDCNHNHVQDAEELGIPGVRLVMQDGSTLVSDSEGKYSLCGLPPRSAVLKVDALTLPRGSRLTTSSNRNLGDAGSLWLDLKNGELHRADFVEGSCSNTVLEQTKARRAQGEVRAPEPEKKRGPALRFDSKAHGKSTVTSPQQGTDGANQRVPKPRPPTPPPPGPVQDETNVPSTELPMNQPAPTGRDSGQAADAGGSHGTR